MPRPRGEQNRLWRHPNGKFYILWEEDGQTRRLSTHQTSSKEATKFRDQYLANLANHAPAQPTINYLLKRYKEEHGPKTRSLETITFHIKALTPHFGNLTPNQITNIIVSEYAKKQKHLSAGTIIRHLNTLKAAIRYASGNGWIDGVPLWQMPVKNPPPRDRWLSQDEYSKLLAAAKSQHQKLFIMLALNTAARSAAILELKWSDVDFKNGLISFGRGHGNKKRAIVPMNNDLKNALKDAYRGRLSDNVVEWRGKPIKRAYRAFYNLARELGLQDVSPHTLRHTAATWMVMRGVPLEQVARFLGDSATTVERVYGKHSPKYLKRAAKALEVNSLTV